MSEAKFTRGSWELDLYSSGSQVDVISECGRKTLHCNKIFYGGHLTSEDLANAHLIATAPEMYEMLEYVMKCAAMQDNLTIDANEISKLLEKARGEQND